MSVGASGLSLLAESRGALLVCELAAVLHDLGKLSEEFVAQMSKSPPSTSSGFSHERAIQDVRQFVDPSFPKALQSRRIADRVSNAFPFVPSHARLGNLLDLILQHDSSKHSAYLVRLLNHCDHMDSGADKGTTRRKGLPQQAKQLANATFWATVFGAEPSDNRVDAGELARLRRSLAVQLAGWLREVESSQEILVRDRDRVLDAVKAAFVKALGETRRPANDVLLWDHSYSVGTLYKAALAGCLLEETAVEPHEVRWRLLRVSFNGLAFLQQASRVGDILGRQAELRDAQDRLKELLEVTYPLGNEVYRDENGSAFVVPALGDNPQGGDAVKGLVQPLVFDAFRRSGLGGEVQPRLDVSDPSRRGEELHRLLVRGVPPTAPFHDALRRWWGEGAAIEGEIDACPVCRVRPMGTAAPSDMERREAVGRESCWVCLERRARRSADWLDDEGAAWRRTIWLDEAADRHGRLALVVGRFDLRGWLDGAMVGTMLARIGSACVPKNPSFARLQRVWKTTKGFWRSIDMDELPKMLPSDRRRLIITPHSRSELGLEANHVYDAEVRDVRTAVVWDARRGALVTADDLGRLASRLGAQKSIADDQVEAGRHVARLLDEVRLYRPGGYGQRRLPLTALTVAPGDVCLSDLSYSPFIPLLAEPSTYMCIVPADHALQVVAMIRRRYAEEMGKVRNRLPIFAGVVFFDRRHPLSAVLDAGRRMLDLDLVETEWVLERPPEMAGCERILSFKGGAQWRVPVKIGDGTTPDEWYPYYRVKADAHGQPPMGRRQFVRDTSTGECWVHVEDLQPGDRVTVAPARFSYLHLDSSARRFEVPRLRRWLLEDEDEMIGLWQKLEMLAVAGRLTDSRLRAVWSLVQAKWDGWWLDEPPASDAPPEEAAEYRARRGAFEKLVSAALQVEGIADGVVRPEQVQSGLLQATLEMHLDVMKKRLASACQSSLEVEV